MKKNKLNKIEKKVLLVETLFIIGIFIYLFFINSPTAISPISGQIVSDPDFIFEIQNGDKIIISSDLDFENSFVLEPDDDIVLPPGSYYWKVKGLFRESEIYSFEIESNVGLDLFEGEEKSILENSGNVGVEVKDKKSGITSSLGVGEYEEVEKDQSFEGGQNE